MAGSKEKNCPTIECHEKNIEAINLLPNRYLRNKVALFKKETGLDSLPVKQVKIEPQVKDEPQVKVEPQLPGQEQFQPWTGSHLKIEEYNSQMNYEPSAKFGYNYWPHQMHYCKHLFYFSSRVKLTPCVLFKRET